MGGWGYRFFFVTLMSVHVSSKENVLIVIFNISYESTHKKKKSELR